MPKAPKAENEAEPKPKRTLSEDQLAKLKIARAKALEVKKAMKEKTDDSKIKHYEEKIMKLKGEKADEKPVEKSMEEVQLEGEEFEEEKPVEVMKVKKPKPKKKPVIICEQSDSDSGDDSNVIYI